MKSLIPPLIEPESGPPKPPWPIEADAAAADPPDEREELEDEVEALDVPVELPLEAELLPNRFEDVPRKPPLEDPEPPDAEEPPAADELESVEPIVRPAVAEAGELVEEELDEDPLDPPEEPPLSPPPPPDEETCTLIRPPPPDTDTLTVPPRPPRSCGTMSEENLSGTVVPVNRIVCCIRSLVADTVRSETGAPPPGPPVEG